MSEYHQEDDEMLAELECWELDDFLDASPINEDIYDRIMTIRKVSGFELHPVRLFRACYYQLYRAYTDDHPELLFDDEYEQELVEGSEGLNAYEVEIAHCIMRSLLDLQPSLPKTVKRYYTQLVIEANKHGSVSETFRHLVSEKKSQGKLYPIDFEYLEFGIELPEDITTADWYTLTHGYQERYIEKYIQMGETEKDQKMILAAIHARYRPFCHKEHGVFSSDDPLDGYFDNQMDLIKIRFLKKKQAVSATPSEKDSIEVQALKEQVSNLQKLLEEQDKDKQGYYLKPKTVTIMKMLKLLNAGLSVNDMTKIANFVSYLTGGDAKKIYNNIQEGIILTDFHNHDIAKANQVLSDLGLKITITKGE